MAVLKYMLLIILIFVTKSLSQYEASPLDKLDSFFRQERQRMNKRNERERHDPSHHEYFSFKPKSYIMDMKDSVDVRWRSLCNEYSADYTKFYDYLNNQIELTGAEDILYPAGLYWFNQYVEEPYKSEIEYFSECTNIPLEGIIMMNLFEIFLVMGCTSIVAADENDIIYFGRNFDIGNLAIQEILRNLIINVRYKSARKDIIFDGYSFFGYSGIIAGVKQDAFSISVNSRYTGYNLIDALYALQNGYIPQTWLIRNTLFDYNYVEYNDAFNALQTTSIISPCYYIIGGAYYPDGAIITRNLTHSVNNYLLESSDFEWFILQTNTDWWEIQGDRWLDGVENMNLLGRTKVSRLNLMSFVLDSFETFNIGTIASTVMIPHENWRRVHNTIVVQYDVNVEDDIDNETSE